MCNRDREEERESNDEVKELFIQIAGDYDAGRGRERGIGEQRGPSFSAASVAVSRCELP